MNQNFVTISWHATHRNNHNAAILNATRCLEYICCRRNFGRHLFSHLQAMLSLYWHICYISLYFHDVVFN